LVKCLTARSRLACVQWFQSLRGVRIINFIAGLVFSLHLFACGWYLCAALHDDVHETWVARRTISDGRSLLEGPPMEQWLHAMYFVLTVFTTVGFGDMSAGTEAEILFVAATMLYGAVIHSIIISEVIRVVTSTDQVSEFIDKQMSLCEAFAEHTQLPWDAQSCMKEEIRYRARSWATNKFDKGEMKELITGKNLPRWLLGSLPAAMFQGRLLKNALFRAGAAHVPPRLPCLLAVHLQQSEFEAGEIVYQMHDFPFNLFLVLSGVFAHIALPKDVGGVDAVYEAPDAVKGNGGNPKDDTFKKSVTVAQGGSSKGKLRRFLSNYTTASKSAPARRESGDHSPQNDNSHLYPYRLCGCNTYFGDVEMLRSRPRHTTVRCESTTALTMALHKTDFSELRDQFPQFAALWTYAAVRREGMRQEQLKRLTHGLSYRALAVCQIQKYWRSTRGMRTQASANSVRRGHSGSQDGDEVPIPDMHNMARKQYLNNATVKIMDKKDCSLQESTEGDVVSRRLDVIRVDIDILRQDMRKVVNALGALTGEGSRPVNVAAAPAAAAAATTISM